MLDASFLRPWLRVLLLLGAALMLAACSVQMSRHNRSEADKHLAVPPGKALVYVYRPSSEGHTVVFDLAVNGTYIGKSEAQGYFLIEAPAGMVKLTAQGDNTAERDLHVQAGHRYYVFEGYAPSLFTGRASLALQDAVSGRRGLRNTSLLREVQL